MTNIFVVVIGSTLIAFSYRGGIDSRRFELTDLKHASDSPTLVVLEFYWRACIILW